MTPESLARLRSLRLRPRVAHAREEAGYSGICALTPRPRPVASGDGIFTDKMAANTLFALNR